MRAIVWLPLSLVLLASAANYVLAQVPDGVRRLKLSHGNVENLVRKLLPA